MKHSFKPLDKIYTEVAKELGVSKTRVKLVVEDVFQQVRNNFRSLKYPSILLNKFGTFFCNKRAVRHMLRKNKNLSEQEIKKWNKYLNEDETR